MDKIIYLIKNIGVTNPVLLILICIAIIIIIQLYLLIKNIRTKNLEIVNEKTFKELDIKLEEFYIPLRERFQYTKLLKDTTSNWKENELYKNEAVNIESDNPFALRNLVVRKVFLPINEDLHKIILNKMHWADPRDKTDYKSILKHFLLWKTFEDAKESGEIKNYEAKHILSFPFEEIEKQYEMCNILLKEREELRKNVRKYKRPFLIKLKEKKMKLNFKNLIEDRKGFSGDYSCPQYISTDAIIKLFNEVGITPEPKAVGVLGDILENFALSILKDYSKKSISADELKNSLKSIIE